MHQRTTWGRFGGLGAMALLATLSISNPAASPAEAAGKPELSANERSQYRAEGFNSFQLYCVLCHGADGKGGGGAAKFLRVPPGDLTTIAAKNGGSFPWGQVYATIDGREGAGHGLREMPVWGNVLGDVEAGAEREAMVTRKIQELVFYLESIQAKAQ